MKKKNIQNNALARVKIIRPPSGPSRTGLGPYPALRLLVPVIAGILAGTAHPFSLQVWVTLFSLFLAVVLLGLLADRRLGRGRFPGPVTALAYLALVSLAFGAYADLLFNHVPKESLIGRAGRSVVLSGRVATRPSVSEEGASFVLVVDRIHEEGRERELHDRAAVFMRGREGEGPELEGGEMVLVKGVVGIPGGPANRGEFDPHRAARLKRASAALFAAGPWQVMGDDAREPGLFRRLFVRPVHDYILSTLESLFPDGPRRRFMAGVLAGHRERLDPETGEAFRRTGTAHILAVSGLHVGLVVLVAGLFLQRLRVTGPGRLVAFLLTAFLLVVYGSVAGGAASVRRASLMAVALLGGGVAGRRSYPLNSLALADVVILAFDPLELFSPGFQMTNGAVAGILLLLPRLHSPAFPGGGGGARLCHALRGSLMLTVAASLGVAPLIALYFGSFSLVGFAANMPVVFFSSMMVYALMPTLVANLFSPALASLFAASASLFAGLAIDGARWFAGLPFASFPVAPGGAGIFGWYLLLVALLLFLAERTRPLRAVVLMLLGANLLVWAPLLEGKRPPPPSFLTVNLGRDTAVLFSSGRESLLVDGGRRERSLERALRQREAFGMAPLSALAAFALPDSLVPPVPGADRMLRGEGRLRMPSIVALRPEDGVVRAWSRRHSLLMVKGAGRLRRGDGAPRRADIAVVRLGRFRPEEAAALSGWHREVSPACTVLVPGPFMPRRERGLLGRFAAAHDGVRVRGKAGQVAFP